MYQISENDIMDTLNDFKAFSQFIDDTNPKLSARTVTLGKKDAFEVNSKLKHRKEVNAPNYLQNQYPTVDLLFNLAIHSNLYAKAGNQKLNVYLQPTERKGEFEKLNPFEQYAFLLEAFWTRLDLKAKFSYFSIPEDSAVKTFSVSKPGHPLYKGAFSDNPDYDELFSNQANFIRYFSFLGFCTYTLIDHKKSVGKYEDIIQEVIPTALGVSLSGMLKDENYVHWNIPFKENLGLEDEDLIPGIPASSPGSETKEEKEWLDKLYQQRMTEGYKPLATYLATAFPKDTVRKTISLAPETEDGVQGNYFFKVALKGKTWRVIRLSGKHTLEDLHLTIQKAYQFDNDHLYAFCMNGKMSEDGIYNSPWSETKPYANEVTISELKLYHGKKFLYVFDFGDNWQFQIQLIQIDETTTPDKNIEMVESKGKGPKQYQDFSWQWS